VLLALSLRKHTTSQVAAGVSKEGTSGGGSLLERASDGLA
jgi:hypothetical protein